MWSVLAEGSNKDILNWIYDPEPQYSPCVHLVCALIHIWRLETDIVFLSLSCNPLTWVIVCGSKDNATPQFSSATLWVLGTELRPSALFGFHPWSLSFGDMFIHSCPSMFIFSLGAHWSSYLQESKLWESPYFYICSEVFRTSDLQIEFYQAPQTLTLISYF